MLQKKTENVKLKIFEKFYIWKIISKNKTDH